MLDPDRTSTATPDDAASIADSQAEDAPMRRKPAPRADAVPVYALWRFASKADLVVVAIGAFISMAVGALFPLFFLFMEPLLTAMQNAQNPVYMSTHNIMDDVLPTVLLIAACGVVQLVGGYVCQMCWVLTGENQTKRIREAYVQAVLRQDMDWFDASEDGSLTTRLAQDTQVIQQGISENVGSILQSIAQFVAGFAVAFLQSWRMSLVMLACLPLLAGSGGWMINSITVHTTASRTAYAGAGVVVEQVVSGIRTVYSFSLQKRFQRKYEQEIVTAEASDALKGRAIGLGVGSLIFTMFATYGLAFWYGSRLVIDGSLAGSTVTVVFFALLIGSMGMISLPQNLSQLSSARTAAFKIFTTIARVPAIDSSSGSGAKPATVDGDLELEDVHFSYPTRPDIPVLRGLNLKIEKGSTVAFVGASGSGKSTSIALIQRFYDPTSGVVRLDGRDLKDLNVKWLRQQIGVVSQEPVLFNATIRENILMGATRDVTEQDVIEACKQANCHAFISALPGGYNTMVGERGGMLSGGQKQRIAIARALIKDPKILLLDEATSALDTASERIVQAALDKISHSRTTVVVAHRLSTVRHADQIIVMKSGLPVEQGTHEELIALKGAYFELVEKQKIKTQDDESQDPDEAFDFAEIEKREIAEAAAMGATEEGGVRVAVSTEATSDSTGIKETTLRLDDAAAIIAREKATRKRNAKEAKIIAKSSEADDAIGRVIRMMKPEWPFLAVGAFAAAVSGCIFPIFSYALGNVVGVLLQDKSKIDPGPFQGANFYAFGFVLVGIVAFFSYSMNIYFFQLAAAKFVRRLRAQMFAALMKQEVGYFDHEDNALGAVTSRLATDATAVADLVTSVWGDVVQLIFTVICGLGIAFVTAWNLTLIIIIVVPFLAAATWYESRIHHGVESSSKKAYEKSGEVAAEAFKEIRTVAALTRECYFQEKYVAAIHNPHRLALRKAYLSSLGHGANSGFQMFATALGFYAGFLLIAAGQMEAGDLYTCIMAVTVTAQSVGRSSLFPSYVSKGKIAAVKAFNLLFRQTRIDPDRDGEAPLHIDGDFEFRDVAFAYPSRPDQMIFNGEFNLAGKANQTIALVGPSGCGKSTTIGMLERFYDCVSGVVSLDSKDVKSYQLIEGLRRHIALVGQEPTLFDMSIGENIMWGSDRDFVPKEEVVEAAKMANIYDFVMSLPRGFDTRVGAGGSQLSGGQKQRIAIARALIRKPSILLLDEATSALDSESEKLVQEAIDNAIGQRSRTVVTIAHRLSTVQDADLIAVVKDGRVVESGTHFELLDLNGVYADLVSQQSLNVLH